MPTNPAADPSGIVAAATGFMAAKQLFAANELGVFTALADGGKDVAGLAAAAGIPERSARILADAMVGLGLVDYHEGTYANGAAAQAYLAGSGEGLDLRAFLTFWDAISYPHWLTYAGAARKAEPSPFDMNAPENQGTFMGGVMTYNALHALMLAEAYDFSAHKNAIDLAGLSVEFLGQAALRNPGLKGTFVASGPMLEMVKAGVNPAYADQIEFVGEDAVAGTYDLVLLEHTIHRYDVAENKAYLRRAREIAEDGAKVIIVDFLLDASDGRRLDPLLAGEYMNIDGTIVYPEDEVKGWLADTGWKWLETRELPGSPRAMIGITA